MEGIDKIIVKWVQEAVEISNKLLNNKNIIIIIIIIIIIQTNLCSLTPLEFHYILIIYIYVYISKGCKASNV